MNDNEKYIEEFVKDIPFDTPDDEHRDELKQQLLNAFPKHRLQTTVHTVNVRRIIMKSPFIKVAAAAIIIIAVLIGLTPFGRPTPLFAEIIQPFLTARTASFKMTMQVEGAPTQKFDCLYAEPIRMRQTNEEQGAVVVSDLQKGKIVTLVPAQKKAFVMELENLPEDQSQFNMFIEIRKRILETQESEDTTVEFLGEMKINGMTTIGYHVQKPGVDMTVWADKRTKLPVQMKNSMGPVTYTMTDIVFDVEVDEKLFSQEIPAEYTVHTLQVDASEPTEKDLVNLFRTWAEHMDGNLPSDFEQNVITEFVRYQRKKMKDKGQEPSEEDVMGLQKIIQKINRGGMFVQSLPAESNWCYVGADVKFGDSEKAVFWYKPEGSETFRVIYGDLHIENIAQDELPR
jgi:outer membrane lipoprotein-sorting protein